MVLAFTKEEEEVSNSSCESDCFCPFSCVGTDLRPASVPHLSSTASAIISNWLWSFKFFVWRAPNLSHSRISKPKMIIIFDKKLTKSTYASLSFAEKGFSVGSKNPTIYNIIRWFAGPMGQTTRRPSIWCSKYYLFSHNFSQNSFQKILTIYFFITLQK